MDWIIIQWNKMWIEKTLMEHNQAIKIHILSYEIKTTMNTFARKKYINIKTNIHHRTRWKLLHSIVFSKTFWVSRKHWNKNILKSSERIGSWISQHNFLLYFQEIYFWRAVKVEFEWVLETMNALKKTRITDCKGLVVAYKLQPGCHNSKQA